MQPLPKLYRETNKLEFVSRDAEMRAAPVNPEWILEGAPVARNAVLSTSHDGCASTFFWDCTAGRFDWYYDIDETICILGGAVSILDDSGVERCLNVGDTAFFPAGSHAVWHVESYVRKVAFCRSQLPKVFSYTKRAGKAMMQILTSARARSSEVGAGSREETRRKL
ncbi:cupin domain-containing protein [Rhodoblastus sp.]|uniref:cupin domain-containing protein n=1 Tax=Rhodoblastus sp. TaxID=1962975 RepID=UPI003F948ABE